MSTNVCSRPLSTSTASGVVEAAMKMWMVLWSSRRSSGLQRGSQRRR
jgi:hypothetical protein